MFSGLSNIKGVIPCLLYLLYEHHSLALCVLRIGINACMHIFEMSILFQRVLNYRMLGQLQYLPLIS